MAITRPARGWGAYQAPWPNVAAAVRKADDAVYFLEGFTVHNVGHCWFYYDASDSLLFCDFQPETPTFRLARVKKPNKAPEPTPLPVTIRAYARLAPGSVVAHL
jgi:hypothetical protein